MGVLELSPAVVADWFKLQSAERQVISSVLQQVRLRAGQGGRPSEAEAEVVVDRFCVAYLVDLSGTVRILRLEKVRQRPSNAALIA